MQANAKPPAARPGDGALIKINQHRNLKKAMPVRARTWREYSLLYGRRVYQEPPCTGPTGHNGLSTVPLYKPNHLHCQPNAHCQPSLHWSASLASLSL